VTRAGLAVIVVVSAASPAAAIARQAAPPAPAPAAPQTPAPDAATPQAAPEPAERSIAATPGAPTIGLADAVRLALSQSFPLLDSRDAVAAASWRARTAFAEFLPSLTSLYLRGQG
jgi:hypothetical protein